MKIIFILESKDFENTKENTNVEIISNDIHEFTMQQLTIIKGALIQSVEKLPLKEISNN